MFFLFLFPFESYGNPRLLKKKMKIMMDYLYQLQVHGYGPLFKIKLSLTNTTSKTVQDILVGFLYNAVLYKMDKSIIQVSLSVDIISMFPLSTFSTMHFLKGEGYLISKTFSFLF